jgi:hypothetical protein
MKHYFGFALFAVLSSLSAAQETRFSASLDGSQEVPAVATTALGWGTVTLNAAATEVAIKLYFSGLSSNQTMGHIHGSSTSGQQGTTAGVAIGIGSQGALTGNFTLPNVAVTAAQVEDLRAGRWYFNVHSVNNGGGEIRGQILPEVPYYSVLLPIHENPAVTTAPTASGVGKIEFNATNDGFRSDLVFEGLSSNQTLGHIHSSAGPAANGGVVFNIGSQGATSGAFEGQTFTATDEQINLMRAGRNYYNVHTANNGGGEIRGQILRGAPIYARLQGGQEVPAVDTTATGLGFVQLNASETGIYASAFYAGLGSNATIAHIHTGAAGATGGVTFNLTPVTTFVGGTSGFAPYSIFPATLAQITTLKAGGTYFNVHSTNNGGGEIRGQIDGVFGNGLEQKAFQALSFTPDLTRQTGAKAATAQSCSH